MSFVYFTDRDLGKRFPKILKSGGLTVERHADHFADDAPDELWLEAVGKRRWIALTHDRRIRYKPNELNAVMQHGVALLVIVGKAPFPDLARSFVNSRAVIENFLRGRKPPFIAKFIDHRHRRPRHIVPLPDASSIGILSFTAPPKTDGPARFVATISTRTQKKDLFAAQKTLPFNDFSHFAQCA